MPDGPGGFRQGSTCPVVLRIPLGATRISSTGFAPSLTELSISFDYLRLLPRRGPTTPVRDWFGLLRFRSPLLSESLLFSFPPGTKMFQFPGLSSLYLSIQYRIIPHCRYWVAPFGDPRIVVCVRLPEAFRRYLRPSSALYAKTSTVRSFLFIHLSARYFFSDIFMRTVNCHLFPDSVNLYFTTLQKDLSVFLSSLFSFQRTIPEKSF